MLILVKFWSGEKYTCGFPKVNTHKILAYDNVHTLICSFTILISFFLIIVCVYYDLMFLPFCVGVNIRRFG